MVVAPVSNVNLKSYRNNVHFGQRAEDDGQDRVQHTPKKASNFVKVPVIVMMAMSPAMLNSISSAQAQDNNYEGIELLAMASPSAAPQSTSSTYSSTRSSYVRPSITQYEKRFTTGGTTYTMYYVHPNKESYPNSKNVTEIYFVPAGYTPMNPYRESSDRNIPPRMVGLKYHDLGAGKEFVGVVVNERKYNKSANTVSYYEKEIKLPENISDELMDLYKGRTRFQIAEKGSIAKMFQNLQVTTATGVQPEKLIRTTEM